MSKGDLLKLIKYFAVQYFSIHINTFNQPTTDNLYFLMVVSSRMASGIMNNLEYTKPIQCMVVYTAIIINLNN